MKLALTLLAGAAFALAAASSAGAADLLKPVPADPIYSSPLFNFDGFYVGGTAGLASYANTGYGSVGVVVGSNFAVTDGIVIGGEFQGDIYFNGGISAFDALALGRVGGFIADNIMLYGEAGAGIVDTTPVYALGIGAEMGLSGNLGVRGELQTLGTFSSAPGAGRATVGLMWHMN
jgi:opacity protein-like surface antigen